MHHHDKQSLLSFHMKTKLVQHVPRICDLGSLRGVKFNKGKPVFSGNNPHLKKTLCKRYLNFIESIKSSKKIALRNLFKVVKYDCRSVTGRNLLNIRLLVNKTTIDSLVPSDAMTIKYHEVSEEQAWRVGVAKELTDVKFGEMYVEGFSRKELNLILNYVCTT